MLVRIDESSSTTRTDLLLGKMNSLQVPTDIIGPRPSSDVGIASPDAVNVERPCAFQEHLVANLLGPWNPAVSMRQATEIPTGSLVGVSFEQSKTFGDGNQFRQ
jgi:hypothetical protein